MTRIKLLALSTVTAAMILGSSIVLASSPSAVDSGETTVDETQQTTEWLMPKPGGRRSGGAGFHLKN